MSPAGGVELPGFARYLLAHVPALAARQAAQLERGGLAGVPAPALEPGLQALVAALARGEWPADPARVPVLPTPPPPAAQLVRAYHAREAAMAAFVPGYMADRERALALVAELAELHAALCAAELERVPGPDGQADEFLGMVSHELRTPVHILAGFGGILLRGLAGELNPQQHGYVARMQDVVRVLGRLVDDLIDLAQVGSGSFSLALAPTAVGPLVGETLAQFAPLAREKGLRLAADVAADLPALQADRDRLQQVLVNLVGNAIKFTPPGGEVLVSAWAATDGLHIQVRDTGVGIALGDRQAVFQRFIRRGPDAGGMGLGLAICKAIVEGHGGTIGVESAPGLGSTFQVRLPLDLHMQSKLELNR